MPHAAAAPAKSAAAAGIGSDKKAKSYSARAYSERCSLGGAAATTAGKELGSWTMTGASPEVSGATGEGDVEGARLSIGTVSPGRGHCFARSPWHDGRGVALSRSVVVECGP